MPVAVDSRCRSLACAFRASNKVASSSFTTGLAARLKVSTDNAARAPSTASSTVAPTASSSTPRASKACSPSARQAFSVASSTRIQRTACPVARATASRTTGLGSVTARACHTPW